MKYYKVILQVMGKEHPAVIAANKKTTEDIFGALNNILPEKLEVTNNCEEMVDFLEVEFHPDSTMSENVKYLKELKGKVMTKFKLTKVQFVWDLE